MTMTEVANVIESGHIEQLNNGLINMIGGTGITNSGGPEEDEHSFPSPPYSSHSHNHNNNPTISSMISQKERNSFEDFGEDRREREEDTQNIGGGVDMDQSMVEYDHQNENSMDSHSTIDDDLTRPPHRGSLNDIEHDSDGASSCASGEHNYSHHSLPESRFQMQMICPGSESDDNLDGRDDDSDVDEGKLIIDATNDPHRGQLPRESTTHLPMTGSTKFGPGITKNTKTSAMVGGASRSSGTGGCEISVMSSPSPPRDHSPSSSGASNTILNMMMKERSLANGHYHNNTTTQNSSHHHHSQHRTTSSSLHHHHHQDLDGRHSQHSHGYSGRNGHSRSHRANSGHGASSRTHPRDLMKSERKSQSMSPLHCDVKPESLAAATSSLTNIGNLNTSIGNALLNLASLGSLAALQQSIPNLVSSGTLNHLHNNNNSQNINNTISSLNLSQNQLSSNSNNAAATCSSSSTMTALTAGGNHTNNNVHLLNNSPLNLTNANNNGSNNNSSSNNSSNNHTNNPLNPSALATSQLAQFINQQQQNNFLTSNSSQSSSMPQLILASGQIGQGIQGATVLIPTSQGLVTQTILTIPLNQPGSPSQSLYPTTGSPHLPQHPHRSSSNNSGGHHHSHYGHGGRGHPISPPVAPTVPASPDFSDHPSALPTPHISLGPHSVSQQMGAHIPMIQEKLSGSGGGSDHRGQLNGVRNINGRRESNTITTNGGLSISALCPPPKMSPCSSSQDSDKLLSDNDDSDQMVDGINLDEIKEFAKAFKLRRLSLGLTQTQVGQALSVTEGPAYSQSAICSALAFQALAQSQSRTSIPQPSMFEKLDITPKSAQKIKPVLERWMKEAEDRFKNGHQNLNDFVGMEPSKKRKRRTSFTPQALEILNTHFERNTHPSGAEITTLAHQLGYEREVIRIWFCNKRQALKNTVRMMSKGSSPM